MLFVQPPAILSRLGDSVIHRRTADLAPREIESEDEQYKDPKTDDPRVGMGAVVGKQTHTHIDHCVENQSVEKAISSLREGKHHSNSHKYIEENHTGNPTEVMSPAPWDHMPDSPNEPNKDSSSDRAMPRCERFGQGHGPPKFFGDSAKEVQNQHDGYLAEWKDDVLGQGGGEYGHGEIGQQDRHWHTQETKQSSPWFGFFEIKNALE